MSELGRFAPPPPVLAGLSRPSTVSGVDVRRPVLPRDNGEPGSLHPSLSPAPPHPVGPRFAHELTFFAQLTADLRAEVIGETPDGFRINFYVLGGSICGPRINAEIRAEGGDWMCIRGDGIGIVDINITYDTGDGVLILEQAGGIFQLGPEGLARARAGKFVGSPPFYATPRWVTSSPDWIDLNGVQGFGFGRVVLEKLQVQCDIYLPSVGARLEQ
jgi:hypothetical protein